MLFTDSDAGAAGVGVVYLSGNQPDCYESYVYAFQCGADRADTARSDKGDQTVDYRGRILCRISDCSVDLAQMQVFGKTWLDLCRNRNCSPWNRADFRTGDARLEAVLVDRWNYLPAVGVCQTDVRIFLAAVLSEKTGIRQVVAAGIGATAHVLILVLSKDLGSALILFMVYVFLMTISAHQPLYLAGGLVAGAGASLLAYRMFSHVQVRVQAWRDPWSVIDKQGYQIAQALFAMSRGGLFGLGIGKGTPQDIPYVETDFIFPQ